MKNDALLPGVQPRHGATRSTTFDGRNSVRKARFREDLRDLIDLLILGAVDSMFLAWDAAHIPGFTREATLTLMLFITGGVALFLILRRLLPLLHARRIIGTWSESERRNGIRH